MSDFKEKSPNSKEPNRIQPFTQNKESFPLTDYERSVFMYLDSEIVEARRKLVFLQSLFNNAANKSIIRLNLDASKQIEVDSKNGTIYYKDNK